MKILFICRNFTNKSGQGIDRVNYKLVEQLKKEKNIEIEIISSKIPIENTLQGVFYDFSLIFKLWKKKADVYYATVPYVGVAPIFLGKKNLITAIYDLIPFFYTGMNFLSRYYYIFCTNICKKSDKIITISNYSKKEILNCLKLKSKDVKRIYLAIDPGLFYPKKIKKNKKFKIGFIGGLTKQKNPIALIKAFKDLNDKNTELVIGGKGKEFSKLVLYVKEHNIENIQFLGYVPDKELPDFYRGLNLFVYPSLHEGFGLPPLEAMACGVPVICSNRESLPEVVGNAAILVNPNKIEEIKRAIEKVLNSKKLQKDMRNLGLIRAKNFSWEKTAEEYLKVIKNID